MRAPATTTQGDLFREQARKERDTAHSIELASATNRIREAIYGLATEDALTHKQETALVDRVDTVERYLEGAYRRAVGIADQQADEMANKWDQAQNIALEALEGREEAVVDRAELYLIVASVRQENQRLRERIEDLEEYEQLFG